MLRPALGIALLLACGPQGQPPPATSPSPTPSSARLAEPPAPAPPPSDAPEVAQPTGPGGVTFHVAAWRDGYFDLHVLGDGVFVSGSGGLARTVDGGRLVDLERGLAGQAEPWLGFDGWRIHAFGGRWPDNAWLVTEFTQSRATSPPHVHRRDGDEWKIQPNKHGILFWYYESVIPWRDGQVLGLRAHVHEPTMDDDVEELPAKIRRKIDAQLARSHRGFDVLGETPTPTTMVVDRKFVDILHVAAAPTGELFALGRRGDYNDGPRFIQRWGLTGPAAAAGAVDPMPASSRCVSLTVRAADEAYVGCSIEDNDVTVAHIRRFDGAAWSAFDTPAGFEVRRLSVAANGDLWAVIAVLRTHGANAVDELWRRPQATAAWERVVLPELRFPDRAAATWIYEHGPERYRRLPGDPAAAERVWPLEPTDVLAHGPDDVWVTASTDMVRGELGVEGTNREVVLRTRFVGEPLHMLHDEDLTLEALDWRPAPAWKAGEGCPDERPAFVVLRTLPDDAPPGRSEPLLEAFVRDNPGLLASITDLFEVHHHGRRAVALFAALPDQPAADALLAALERAAPGEPRTLECRRPRVRRAFDRTGRPAP